MPRPDTENGGAVDARRVRRGGRADFRIYKSGVHPVHRRLICGRRCHWDCGLARRRVRRESKIADGEKTGRGAKRGQCPARGGFHAEEFAENLIPCKPNLFASNNWKAVNREIHQIRERISFNVED